MLRHTTNPALWADGSPRSQGNVFDMDCIVDAQQRIDIKKEAQHARARARSSAQVDAVLASGGNLSVGALRNSRKPHTIKARQAA